jgi:hypothetical protein
MSPTCYAHVAFVKNAALFVEENVAFGTMGPRSIDRMATGTSDSFARLERGTVVDWHLNHARDADGILFAKGRPILVLDPIEYASVQGNYRDLGRNVPRFRFP